MVVIIQRDSSCLALSACGQDKVKVGFHTVWVNRHIHHRQQCVLEIVNTSAAPLRLGDDGLPVTSQKGHGLGMLSLRNFLKRYNGYADFTQEGDKVTLSMYWEDKKC